MDKSETGVYDFDRNKVAVVKLAAVLLVVIHHAINNFAGGIVARVILQLSQSDVVIFFIVSGYLFRTNVKRYRQRPANFVANKFALLMVPYLFWTLTLYIGVKAVYGLGIVPLATMVKQLGFTELSWKQILYNTATMNRYYVEYLWFVYVLFLFFAVRIIMEVAHLRFDTKAVIITIAVFVVGASIIDYYADLPELVWKFLRHFPNFLFGEWLAMNGKLFRELLNKKVPLFITSILLLVSALCLQGIPWGGIAIIKEAVTRFLSWCVFFDCVCFAECYVKKKHLAGMQGCGNFTYGIYLMHLYIVLPVSKLMSVLGWPYGVSILVITASGMVIPYAVYALLRRIKICRYVMFGEYRFHLTN